MQHILVIVHKAETNSCSPLRQTKTYQIFLHDDEHAAEVNNEHVQGQRLCEVDVHQLVIKEIGLGI